MIAYNISSKEVSIKTSSMDPGPVKTEFHLHPLDGYAQTQAEVAAMRAAGHQEQCALGLALFYEYFSRGCSQIDNLSASMPVWKRDGDVMPRRILAMIPPRVQVEMGRHIHDLCRIPEEVGADEGK
jgi:hypothetical protein